MKRIQHATCLGVLGLAFWGAGAALAYDVDDYASVTLLPGWRTESGTHMIGIKVDLAPGWHTYWRNPGAAGIPPQLDLQGSINLDSYAMHWPLPEIFDASGQTTIGYHDSVVFPVELTPATQGSITLEGELLLGVCEEICIPFQAEFRTILGPSGVADREIIASLDSKPVRAKSMPTCAAKPISDGLQLIVSIPSSGTTDHLPHLVIETGDPSVWVSPADVSRNSSFVTAITDLVPVDAKPFLLERSGIRVTAFGEDDVVEYLGCAAPS